MSHLTHETIWDAAQAGASADARAHLELCADCRAELDNVKFARELLAEPPPPPPLSDASARRIGDVLRAAAEQQAARRAWWMSWWPFGFNPTYVLAPIAVALLAFAAYRLTQQALEPQPTIAKKIDAPAPAPSPAPVPEVKQPEQPAPAPAKKLLASVTSAKKAGGLKKAQQLTEGSKVATSKGGSLWMKLPDGSRAGLTGASQVQLLKLEEKAVTLDITSGSLVVVARHDPTRELRVRAGDLEIVDVGTRFLVSRDERRTLVAVEEGEVEVDAKGSKVPLRAGQAVEWKNGKLERQQWAVADEQRAAPPPPQHKVAQAPPDSTPDIPSEPQEVQKPPPPQPAPAPPPPAPPEKTPSDPGEWALPDSVGKPSEPPSVPPAVPPAPAVPNGQAAQGAPTTEGGDDAADESFLQRLERKLRSGGPFKRGPSRLERVNDIARLADVRSCTEAIMLADEWLTEEVPRGESFNLRRSVLNSKLRCLNYQGRTGDAAAVQREIEKL